MSGRVDDDMLFVWVIDAENAEAAADLLSHGMNAEEAESAPSVLRGFLIAGLCSVLLWSAIYYLGRLMFG